MNLKLIISVSAIVVLLITGILLYYFLYLKKKGQSSGEIWVKVKISDPAGTYKGNTYFSSSQMKAMTIESFINKSVANVIPYSSINYVEWKTTEINGKTVDPTSSTLIVTKIGALTQYSLTGTFQHSCPINEKIDCSGSDPCQGYAPYCSPSKGWVCKKGQKCPTDKQVLASCCANSSTGPVPYCSNNIVECKTCTGPKPSCKGMTGCDPCKGCGPICTANGWACQEGVQCPVGTALDACCQGTGKHPVCDIATNYEVLCTPCTGPSPTGCKPDCFGSGIVCGSDGKFKCEKGALCPPDSILKTCCANSPTGPVAICDIKTKKITCNQCTDCPPAKPKQPCSQSCDGRGWKCTADGCKCEKGVACPSQAYAQKYCCPSNLVATCDKNPNSPTYNSIVCTCPAGTYECGQGNNRVCCANKCCQNNPPSSCGGKKCCNQVLGMTGHYACCEKDRACMINNSVVCCPVGSQCQNNQCVALCGPVPCGPGEKCVKITNLTPQRSVKLKQEYGNKVNISGTTAYLCVDTSGSCEISGNEEAVPPTIQNYYPCYAFPNPDPSFGVGYCVGKSEGDTETCYNSHKDPTTCNADGKCEWRDVLSHMSSNTDINSSASDIQTDMELLHKNKYGNYCSPAGPGESFQRVVSLQFNNSCDVKDCLNMMSQPSVTDLDWNSNTKICSVLQTCGSNNTGGLQNNVVSVYDDEKVVEHENDSIRSPISGGVSTFSSLCSTATCPSDITRDGKVCDKPSGRIHDTTYSCITSNSPIPGAEECLLKTDGSGSHKDSSCGGGCSCGFPYLRFQRHTDPNNPGKTICTQQPPANWEQTTKYWGCESLFGLEKCKYQDFPKGYYYCDQSDRKWKECTGGGCNQPGDGWTGRTSVPGNLVGYCS